MSEASDGTLGWRLEKSLPSGFGFQSATGSSAGRSPDRHNTELCNRGAQFPREPFPSEATATPGRQRRAPQQFQCTWPMQAEAMPSAATVHSTCCDLPSRQRTWAAATSQNWREQSTTAGDTLDHSVLVIFTWTNTCSILYYY